MFVTSDLYFGRMLPKRMALIALDTIVGVARTMDGALDARAIQNSREALIEGRRNRVLRMLLEEADKSPAPRPEKDLPEATSV